MKLGAFSVSLAVADIEASRAFYAKFGFEVVGGDAAQNWLILRNGTTTIGLFQGMFEQNILTFNPGWDCQAQPLESFTDVRELQRQLKAQGVEIMNEADEDTTGPASFVGRGSGRQCHSGGPARLKARALRTTTLEHSLRNSSLIHFMRLRGPLADRVARTCFRK